MIVGQQVKRVDIPHEPTQWFELRELSGLELDEAADIRSDKISSKVLKLDPELLKIVRESRNEEPPPRNPMQDYDWGYLVKKSIIGWSYPIECNDENKVMLDRKTLEWVVGEIINLNVRPVGEFNSSGSY